MATKKFTKKIGLPLLGVFLASAYFFYDLMTVDTSNLESLAKETPKYAPVISKNENVVQVQQETKVKAEKTEEDIRFIVSRDFNAVLSCQQMLSNALNKEVQGQWAAQRMNVIAQRERTRTAELALEEQKAAFSALQLSKKTKALEKADSSNFGLGGLFGDQESPEQQAATVSDVWPNISLLSITADEKATFQVNGVLYTDRKKGEMFEQFLLSEVELDSGCVSFVAKSNLKRFCM
ncbi:hypothetical protein [Pseudoalteromonas luteoviolacea]|uniref:Uncharacterized protein n=1 Tax=Pseudoalteromonas luteoviolacea S4060-1 TaxID=1365257 RepID=A0A167KWA5_9GAMM|nr:hypothetical protein [Pseudoalteromonas luteoviolacea]KZN63390.1 hypothetical protein N478_03815 [Pseudoalteromonas luteoviolacea S4060-1]